MNRERTIQRRLFRVVAAIAAPVLLLFASCSNPVDSEETADCEPGVIIPGVCIDGVRLGDSRERVEKLLGEPAGIGWADGYRRAWRTYTYKPPGAEGLGFSILFIEEEDLSWGPADMLTVHEPYDGQTPEGIGIGSTFDKILEVYGEPDFTAESDLKNGKMQGTTIYCIDSVKFEISTLDQVVRGIGISHYLPIKQDVLCTTNK